MGGGAMPLPHLTHVVCAWKLLTATPMPVPPPLVVASAPKWERQSATPRTVTLLPRERQNKLLPPSAKQVGNAPGAHVSTSSTYRARASPSAQCSSEYFFHAFLHHTESATEGWTYATGYVK